MAHLSAFESSCSCVHVFLTELERRRNAGIVVDTALIGKLGGALYKAAKMMIERVNKYNITQGQVIIAVGYTLWAGCPHVGTTPHLQRTDWTYLSGGI